MGSGNAAGSSNQSHGIFIHARPAYLDVWPVGVVWDDQELDVSSRRLFNRSGFFLLQLACLVGRAPDLRKRKRRPIQMRVFVPASPLMLDAALKSRVQEILAGLRIEVSLTRKLRSLG